MERTRGKVPMSEGTGVRALISGMEGIGKTTLASKLPRAVIIDLEEGSAQVECERITGVQSWSELIKVVTDLGEDKSVKTIVIDTIDKAEELLTQQILKEKGKTSVDELMDYGRIYGMLSERWGELMRTLEAIRKAKGKHICLVSHTRIKSISLPEAVGAYEAYLLKLSKGVASQVKEWADVHLFLMRQLLMQKDGGDIKATAERLVMRTKHGASWEAKNRYGLNDPLPLSYDLLRPIFEPSDPIKQATSELIAAIKAYAGQSAEQKMRVNTMLKERGVRTKDDLTEAVATDILQSLDKKSEKK